MLPVKSALTDINLRLKSLGRDPCNEGSNYESALKERSQECPGVSASLLLTLNAALKAARVGLAQRSANAAKGMQVHVEASTANSGGGGSVIVSDAGLKIGARPLRWAEHMDPLNPQGRHVMVLASPPLPVFKRFPANRCLSP